ncbi:MAG: CBS domain-containing protein [Anaerolineae bacterium]
MSIEHDLQVERVSHLDLSRYITVETGTSVRDVLNQMREQGQNCVLVVDEGRLAGIFTERDVLRKIIKASDTWSRPVDEFMTADPDTIRPGELVAHALVLMNAGHYRNVPVVDDQGQLVGNVTHYALTAFLCDRFPDEIYNLPPEPDQVPKTPAGA